MTEEAKKQSGALTPSKVHRLDDLLGYVEGSVVSRTIVKNKGGTVTLFSFDAGQELSEHSAPFDALVQVLDGEVQLVIGGETVPTRAGETVMMPANVPHGLKAVRKFKMLLTMVKD
ncbi:MAG TPA: cupin domain-containing protein [candidate division Zixibacteria bacterium]|nr:cupin domain-containing protein [candidate division Zixibacteria bacterium]